MVSTSQGGLYTEGKGLGPNRVWMSFVEGSATGNRDESRNSSDRESAGSQGIVLQAQKAKTWLLLVFLVSAEPKE